MIRALAPLRRRLPLVCCGVLTLAGAGTGAIAYVQMRAVVLEAARDRAMRAAGRLAAALDESADRVQRDVARLAGDRAVAAATAAPTSTAGTAALGALFARERAGAPSVVALALISRDGERRILADSARGVRSGVLPPTAASDADGVLRLPPVPIGHLALVDGRVVYDVAAPVLSTFGDTVGYLVETRAIERTANRLIGDLIGPDAGVRVGDVDRGVWTDLVGAHAAAGARGPAVLGGARTQSAPWRVVVAIPAAAALAPARQFLSILLGAGALVLVLAGIVMWRVTLHLTGPLAELRDAARDVARGDYARRVGASRRDELGDLAVAFNAMAERVESAARDRVRRASQLEQANRELRDSEHRYRQLVELSPDAILLMRGGRVIYANPAGVTLFGAHSAERMLGLTVLDIVDPAEHAEALERAAAAEYQGRATPLARRTVRRLDGGSVQAETVTIPLVLDGLPTALVVIRDVTERCRAEAALRESESRYRHVTMNVPGMVYSRLHTGEPPDHFTLVSEGARELLGIDPDDALRDPAVVLDLIHPDDRDCFDAATDAAAAALAPFRWVGRVHPRGGGETWVEVVARMERTAEGIVCDGVVLDVSERRRAVQRLEESELRFHLAAQATRDIVYDWDIAADSLVWGATLTAAFGYDPREVDRSNDWWIARLHPEDVEPVLASLDDALDGNADSWAAEYRFRCRDGSYAVVLDRAYLLRDEAGTPLRLVGSMSDLTERKNLEAQLRQAQKMEAVGQLAGGVAHDFNNILTAITSYTDLLLDEVGPEAPHRGWIAEIARGANRAAALTRQLLAFSRRQVLQPRTLDINRTVRELEPMLRRLIDEDIELVVALEREPWAIRADPGQLEQVLVNLAVNARDAMPNGGVLAVQSGNVELASPLPAAGRQDGIPVGSYVCITVSDTGCGMDEATQARIFEPFFTTKDPGKGTGLGLSTVYGIVQQSGGYVRCTSARGAGTTFHVYLPRAVGVAVEDAERLPPPAGPPGGGTETVLLVEDDAAVRDVTRQILAKRGYTVLEATNGVEALELCASPANRIDLIVSDLVMPEMNGPELGRRVRERHPGTALLFMSGYTQHVVLQRSALEPGTAFIEKPFAPRDFAARVREVLDAREPAAASGASGRAVA